MNENMCFVFSKWYEHKYSKSWHRETNAPNVDVRNISAPNVDDGEHNSSKYS